MLVSVDKKNNLPIQEVYYGAEESFFQNTTSTWDPKTKTYSYSESDKLSAEGKEKTAQFKKTDIE